jgi:uncharacterized membrane protein
MHERTYRDKLDRGCRGAHNALDQRRLRLPASTAGQTLAAGRVVRRWQDVQAPKVVRNAAANAMDGFNIDLTVRIAYWATVLLVVVVIGGYVVTRIRNTYADRSQSSVDWLMKIRELHAQGAVSEDEYRTIKTNLAARLRGELSDADERG